MALLEVTDLHVDIGDAHILRGVGLQLEAGKTLGVVGESGCGKSMTGFAIMGMLPSTAKVTHGEVVFDGRNLTALRPREWLDIRGQHIALVMQDPFTSLNPMMKIGDQIAEALILHQKLPRGPALRAAIEMLEKVGVPAPESTASRYPHQLSGGQRQRVVIAIAFACKPEVLIADEPTTALDVTLQAQILKLIKELQDTNGTAVMLISHDIGVIGSLAHRISVFYAGRVVEAGTAEDVLKHPVHPYTSALLAALPRVGQSKLESIAGQPPDPRHLPSGCSFEPRCKFRYDRCAVEPGLLPEGAPHQGACWLAQDAGKQPLKTVESRD
ncbi:MAG: ABC transporter ATP-binding protein [Armatimonadetes bacterium]|nr:ABC transporter ATP-binding protein [Armatimonadota bacterium]